MGLEDLHHNFLTGRIEDLVKWARRNSVWPATFGLACCAIEMMAVGTADYDISRFGMEVFRAFTASSRSHDRRGPGVAEDGARAPSGLRPDDGAEVGDLDGGLRIHRRDVQQLRHCPRCRSDRSGRRLCAWLSTRPQHVASRHPHPSRADQDRDDHPQTRSRNSCS